MSFRVLLFIGFFSAAFLAGLHWGLRVRRLWTLLIVVSVAGLFYAAWNLGLWSGKIGAEYLGWINYPGRPSGPYTNSNRFAILLAICGVCCGTVAATLRFGLVRPMRMRWRIRRVALLLVFLVGVLVVLTATALTLSRWTAASLSLAAGVAAFVATVKAPRRIAPEDDGQEMLARLALPVAAFLLVALAVGAGALTFGGRALGERVELSQLEPSGVSRFNIMRLGATLLADRPVTGWGLGGFEAAFRTRQPLEVTGCYKQVHNDWLQIGIEAGAPALALAALTALGFVVLWWKGLRQREEKPGFWLLLGGGTAVLVPLCASLADFPLREPATAGLFFLLAGAVCALAWRRARRRPGFAGEAPPSVPARAGLWTLAVAGLLVAFHGGRAGSAAMRTPWYGHIDPPPPEAGQAAGYRRGLLVSPDDPDLQYPYARSLLAAWRANPFDAPEGLPGEFAQALDGFERLYPNDYRTAWLTAEAADIRGDRAGTVTQIERAVSLAPSYRRLRKQAFLARLAELSRTGPEPTPQRVRAVRAALNHAQVLLRLEPGDEDWYVRCLRQAGALAYEVADLWPPGSPASALSRARFFATLQLWDSVAAELPRLSPDVAPPWPLVLRACHALAASDTATANAQWKLLIRHLIAHPNTHVETWLAAIVRHLPAAPVVALCDGLADDLGRMPVLTVAFAKRLLAEQQWVTADFLLANAAATTPRAEVYRVWAELALAHKREHDAWVRAKQAYDISDHAPHWRNWLLEFEARCARVRE